MRGTNPIRPPVQHDGSTLDVKTIFLTLQGEGPYAGWPAVFVRLGGCNLACTFCDAEFEEFSSSSISEIISRVRALSHREGRRVCSLVVITGGEPFRQNISPLCRKLTEAGYQVQIETNGTLWRDLPEAVSVVCSPKNTGHGYAPVRTDLLARTQALKFLVSAQDPAYADVAEVGQSAYHIPVYVQPMDMGNAAMNAENAALAVELAKRHGYRLSLQLHKLLGIE